jgi:predicted TIM-barrel fold metal-dependent hydrolase
MTPIIDTHQHLWDLKRFRLPWLKEGSPINRRFLLSDYRQATAGLNVVKTVYMEVDLDPAQQAAEAQFVVDLCHKPDTAVAAGVISGRPASDGFKAYVKEFKGNKAIKGVRQILHVPQTPAGYCLDKQFIKGIRLLGDLGMTFDLCLRPGELGDGAQLVDACPDTGFILDHCGNADVQAKDQTAWLRGMAALAERERVVCKVSGIVVSARPGAWTAEDLAPFVRHTAEVFGRDRIMFGGDWPVCTQKATYKEWVEALKAIVHDWSLADQRKLFHDNAARYFSLG